MSKPALSSWSSTASCAVAWGRSVSTRSAEEYKERFVTALDCHLRFVDPTAPPAKVTLIDTATTRVEEMAQEIYRSAALGLGINEGFLICGVAGVGFCWSHGLGDGLTTERMIVAVVAGDDNWMRHISSPPSTRTLLRAGYRVISRGSFGLREANFLRSRIWSGFARGARSSVGSTHEGAVEVVRVPAQVVECIREWRDLRAPDESVSSLLLYGFTFQLNETVLDLDGCSATVMVDLRRYSPDLLSCVANLIGAVDFKVCLRDGPDAVSKVIRDSVQSGRLFVLHVLKGVAGELDRIKHLRSRPSKPADDGFRAVLTWSDRGMMRLWEAAPSVEGVSVIAFTPTAAGRLSFNLNRCADDILVACSYDRSKWGGDAVSAAVHAVASDPTSILERALVSTS